MRHIQFLSAIAVIGLVAGCSQSDNTTASNDTSTSASRRASRDDTATLSPTSRDSNAPNRLYSADTNSGKFRDADNTGLNERDRSGDTLTSGDQANNSSDLDLTRRIRRALSSNDQFSTSAKNIKIITTDGKVTLRGPVNSAQEQQAIVSTAQSVAGNAQIDNQLEVKANNQ